MAMEVSLPIIFPRIFFTSIDCNTGSGDSFDDLKITIFIYPILNVGGND